jgi:sugar lactone lactonase YvrE
MKSKLKVYGLIFSLVVGIFEFSGCSSDSPGEELTPIEDTTTGSDVVVSDTTAPTAPVSVTSLAVNTEQIDLSWAPASDNVTSQVNLVYEICMATDADTCSNFSANYEQASSQNYTQNFSVTGLSSLSKYYFIVRTRDEAGNVSMPSPLVTAVTLSSITTATPVFEPAQGLYNASQTVVISTTTANAKICYTTDNTTPVCGISSCIVGSIYTSSVTLTSSQTLKAGSCAEGYLDSPVNTASYIIDTISPNTPSEGLTAAAVSVSQIDLFWGIASDNISPQSSLVYEICQSEVSGGCDTFVVSHEFFAGNSYWQTASINNLQPLTPYFFRVRTRDEAQNTSIPSNEALAVTLSEYFTGAPVFIPGSGIYGAAQSVEISSDTPGSLICYSADNTTPACGITGCVSGTPYHSAVYINTTAVLKASACAPGYLDSPVSTSHVIIDETPPNAPGSFTAAAFSTSRIDLSWGISTDNVSSQANLIYEICQSNTPVGCSVFTPTYEVSSGVSYTQTFSVSPLTSGTMYYFNVRTRDEAGNTSLPTAEISVSTLTHETTATPSFSSAAGIYNSPQTVAISSATPEAAICYTLDGSSPECKTGGCTTGQLYSSPVSVNLSLTLKASACAPDYLASPVHSGVYIIDSVNPSVTENLSAMAISADRIDLSWNAASDNETLQSSIVYEICRTTTSGGCDVFNADFTTTSGTLTFSAGSLSPLTQYYFVVRAKDQAGNTGNLSLEVSAETTETGTAAVPVYSPSPGLYNSTQWVSLTTMTPGAEICYTTNGATPVCDIDVCTTGELYAGSFEVASTTTIKAVTCAAGMLSSSVNAGSFTIDTTAPSMPVNFKAKRQFSDPSQVNFTWNASSDDLTPSGSLIYEICQSAVSGTCVDFTPVYTTAAGSVNYSASSINPIYVYYFIIRARDQAGNISPGSAQMAIPDGIPVSTIAGSYPSPQADFIDGLGLSSRFKNPRGITTDGTSLYIADSANHAIRKINISNGFVSVVAGAFPTATTGFADGTGTTVRFFLPNGITTDGTNLYVADTGNHAIRKIVISTGAVTTIAGAYPTATPGLTDGTGTAARFKQPNGIITDGTNLYVADSGNHAIRKIVISSGAVTTIAGACPSATLGFSDGTGTAARFRNPNGITTDGTSLYIADFNNHSIRRIVISTGVVTTLAGAYPTATPGFIDGTSTAARFSGPNGITSDGANLYVTENNNHAIRKIVISTGVVTTIAGAYPTATPGFLDEDGYRARFNSPYGILYTNEVLYITDMLNHAIRKSGF